MSRQHTMAAHIVQMHERGMPHVLMKNAIMTVIHRLLDIRLMTVTHGGRTLALALADLRTFLLRSIDTVVTRLKLLL